MESAAQAQRVTGPAAKRRRENLPQAAPPVQSRKISKEMIVEMRWHPLLIAPIEGIPPELLAELNRYVEPKDRLALRNSSPLVWERLGLNHFQSSDEVLRCVRDGLYGLDFKTRASLDGFIAGSKLKPLLPFFEVHLPDDATNEDLAMVVTAQGGIIRYNAVITDDGMVHCSDFQVVDLLRCESITDAGLDHFGKAREVYLIDCPNIDGEGLQHLEGVRVLSLNNCEGLNVDHLRLIPSPDRITSIDLGYSGVRDEHLELFANAETVSLENCEEVTNQGLAHLHSVKVLNVNFCTGITGAGLLQLPNLQRVELSNLWDYRGGFIPEHVSELEARGVDLGGFPYFR